MGKTLIKVKCIDQRLFVSLAPVLASGGRNEDEIEFDFCPLWDGYEKSAVFYREKNKAYHAVIVDGRCVIPHEVLIDEGSMYFGVFGVKDDTTRTSEIMRYRVTRGAITEGTNPSDPTPDIYAQYVSRIISLEDRTSAIEAFTTQPSPYEITGDLVQLDNYEGMPMDCVTRIEPVQAGGGDPYPAGGGKNKLDGTKFAARTTNGATFAVNTDGSIKVSGTATATANTFADITGKLSPGTYVISHSSDFGAAAYVQITSVSGSKNYWDGQPFTLDGTETKVVAYLQINAGTYNGTAYLQIEAGSTPTAYAPYSNIRPISGRTGAKLTRCGKNLTPSMSVETLTNKGITFSKNTDGTVAANGTSTGYTSVQGAQIDAVNLRGKTVTLKGANAPGISVTQMYIQCESGNIYKSCSNGNDVMLTFSIPEDANTMRWEMYLPADKTVSNLVIYPQLELGSASTAYEPYQGETFTADFGQTVYGGVIDWNKGVLTVDRAMVTLTGNEMWSASSTANAYMLSSGDNSAIFPHGFDVGDFEREYLHACSHYRADIYRAAMQNVSCDVFPRNGSSTIRFKDDTLTTLDAWKAYLAAQNAAGTPVQVCYKLAEPYTIQLTPQQITALQGVNYIWSDAGETTVSGRKDVLWLVNYLIERLNLHESAIISLGGNV